MREKEICGHFVSVEDYSSSKGKEIKWIWQGNAHSQNMRERMKVNILKNWLRKKTKNKKERKK